MSEVDLVTVARQVGAGGSELAHAVGARLGWPVLEHQVVRAAAARLGLGHDGLNPIDEYALNALERVGSLFYAGLPELAPMGDARAVEPDELARAEHAVLRAAVASPPLVVVGHGAPCLFQSRPGSLHVRLFAPFAVRVRRVAAREGLTLEAASVSLKRRDRDRERYFRHHFGCDPHDPMLYALQINTGFVSIAEATESVLRLVDETRRAWPVGERSPRAAPDVAAVTGARR